MSNAQPLHPNNDLKAKLKAERVGRPSSPPTTFSELLRNVKPDDSTEWAVVRILEVEPEVQYFSDSPHVLNTAKVMAEIRDEAKGCLDCATHRTTKSVMTNVLVLDKDEMPSGRRPRYVSLRRNQGTKKGRYVPTTLKMSVRANSRIRQVLVLAQEEAKAKRAAWKAKYKIPTKRKK